MVASLMIHLDDVDDADDELSLIECLGTKRTVVPVEDTMTAVHDDVGEACVSSTYIEYEAVDDGPHHGTPMLQPHMVNTFALFVFLYVGMASFFFNVFQVDVPMLPMTRPQTCVCKRAIC